MVPGGVRLVRGEDPQGNPDEDGPQEVLNEEYIKTARSKGLTNTVVVIKHAFRNALIPVVTTVSLSILANGLDAADEGGQRQVVEEIPQALPAAGGVHPAGRESARPLAILASSGEMSLSDLEALKVSLGLDKPRCWVRPL